MVRMRALSLEALFDVLLLVVGVAIAFVSWGYGFGSLTRPGPGLYPFFVGIAIALCAVAVLIHGLRRPPAEPVLNRSDATRLALIAATFAFWILAMPLLGYVVVTLLATYALAKIMKLEGWRKPLALAGGTALVIYVVFDYWLYIDLPRGVLS